MIMSRGIMLSLSLRKNIGMERINREVMKMKQDKFIKNLLIAKDVKNSFYYK
jgi:hypothetical protein